MEARKRLIEMGWNISEETKCWEENGNLFFAVGEDDDVTGYVTEVNPDNGMSRHCGNGKGCFWTDWE